jgi:nicotinamidase-related amidase
VNKVAVIVVDVQRDFLDPTSARVGSFEKAFCVPGVEQLLAFARDQGWQVIHVGTEHRQSESLPAHQRERGIGLYCEEGAPGAKFVVGPVGDEPSLIKRWYSAFEAEGFEEHVDRDTRIVWAGVATDCCIQQSAFDADRRGIHSIVPYQAVSASKRSAFIESLKGMAKSASFVVDLADVTSGAGVDAQHLEEEEIDARAGAWYDDQVARRGETEQADLDEILSRLRE